MQTNYSMAKATYFSTIILILCSFSLYAQTVLYSENFNGASHTWTLNTTDAQSTVGPNVAQNVFNYWIVNNIYQGGSGTINCTIFGLPFPGNYTFANTPTQPAGITGGPTSNYMHITATDGPMNAGYLGPDGLCVSAMNHFTRMSSDVNTIGYDEVSFKFWWMGTGASNSFMQLFYSTNQGATWTQVQFATPTHFTQNAQWIEETVTRPEFANQATLRFGFRLANGANNTAFPGPSIGYSIDDVSIVGASSSQPNAISTGNINPLSYCTGQTINIPFTATGNYGAGNVFTAQLSNAAGSFASPVNIGTLASTTSGTIIGTIPPGTPSGTGYRVRVVSSEPATTGEQNTSNITITDGQAQTISVTPASPVSFCVGTSVTLTAASGFTNYVWSTGATGASITINTAGTYSVTAQSSDGCGTASSGPIIVNEINVPVASFTYQQNNDTYTINFTNTSQDGASFLWNFGGGNTSTQENPSFTFPFDGTYPVTLTVTNACGTDQITINVVVEKLSIFEIDPELAAVNMFPNPASDIAMLQGETSKPELYVLEIQNMLGQVIHRESFNVFGHWTKSIDVLTWAKGIYNISLSSEKARLSKKLVLQ